MLVNGEESEDRCEGLLQGSDIETKVNRMNNYGRGWFHEPYRHSLAARGISSRIPGGLAEQKYPDLNPEEWIAGIEVELEHTNNITIAAEIALDHLSEDPEYYTKLKRFEKQLEANAVSFKPGPRSSQSTVNYVCNAKIDMAMSNILDAGQRIQYLSDGDSRIPIIVGDLVKNLSGLGPVCSTMPIDEFHYNKFVDIILALNNYVNTGVLLNVPDPNKDEVAMVVEGAAYSLERSLGWKGDYR